MGLSSSSTGGAGDGWESPVDKYDATLYYFSGRGVADQLRWMLAAGGASFTQKVISHKDQLAKMARQQLPFGQLPLLQIDGIEIVQSQAAVRYLANRAGLQGKTAEDALKCDMIAETVRDLLSLLLAAPFKRSAGLSWEKVHVHIAPGLGDDEQLASGAPEDGLESPSKKPDVKTPLSKQELENPEWIAHLGVLKEKWAFIGARFEAILRSNFRKAHPEKQHHDAELPVVYLVGDNLTYADVLVAHVTTWFVEECGPEIVKDMPLLINLQHAVINLPSIRNFLKSINYFPIGNVAYVDQVRKVLNRDI